MIKLISVYVLASFFLGCGVKGDPVAPGIPAEIGRGKPTYKRAMQKLKVKQKSDTEIDSDEAEEEESQDGED